MQEVHATIERSVVSALVIGDAMTDLDLVGRADRISPEAPVAVVRDLVVHAHPGGAANVAAQLAGLGCRTTLAAAIGDDPEGQRLRDILTEASVSPSLVTAGCPTACKRRVIAGPGRQQLLRLDEDGDPEAFAAAAVPILAALKVAVAGTDVVVISDYGKGLLTDELIRRTIEACRRRGIPVVVDPKRAGLAAYAGATILTPNVDEAGRALDVRLDPLDDGEAEWAAETLRERAGVTSLLLTRSFGGMTLATADGVTHHPAEARAVVDVTGAGDVVVAVLAARLGQGDAIGAAVRAASAAAALHVARPGREVITAEELQRALRGPQAKVMTADQVAGWAAEQRRAGRGVVFTNGCFDILHAGHLACLEQARRMGDALVVGLNSDASARALKGPGRPVVGQDDRAALLAGLACVDAVVPFDDPTPESLIRQVEPDVLVKGGDYAADGIVGAESVRSRGGRVATIPLVPGLSTTAILAASRPPGEGRPLRRDGAIL